jgi:hypothetical protein
VIAINLRHDHGAVQYRSAPYVGGELWGVVGPAFCYLERAHWNVARCIIASRTSAFFSSRRQQLDNAGRVLMLAILTLCAFGIHTLWMGYTPRTP